MNIVRRTNPVVYLFLMVLIIVVGEAICDALGFSYFAQMRALWDVCYLNVVHPVLLFLFGV